MLHPSAKLVNSKIEGKGLIAKKVIPKGSIVWKSSPRDIFKKYSIEQYQKFSLRYQKRLDRYSYPDGHGYLVLSGEGDRFWNHSCNANVLDTPDGSMCIAVKDIELGEEITYEYGLNLREDLKIKCNCMEASCRKVVTRLDKNSKVYKELWRKELSASKYKNRVEQPLLR
jgi:SET domain-containing protein